MNKKYAKCVPALHNSPVTPITGDGSEPLTATEVIALRDLHSEGCAEAWNKLIDDTIFEAFFPTENFGDGVYDYDDV